jgi:DNA repair protein RadC
MKEKLHQSGHRLRVRKKFLTSLGVELQDYELLEILLFAANARKDTKIIAKRLIDKFGNISSVINADIEILKTVEGIGEAALVQIKIVSRIIQQILKDSVKSKVVLKNWQALIDYASILLKDLNHEAFHVLFLNKKNQLLEDDLMGIGEDNYVFASSKAIAKKALLLSASSVILLHNHPSGDSSPSESDIRVTNQIISTLKKLEIKVIDHLIISPSGYFSFRESCLL